MNFKKEIAFDFSGDTLEGVDNALKSIPNRKIVNTAVKLHDCKGDLSKRWYVYVTINHFEGEGQKVLHKTYISSKIKSKKQRHEAAKIIIERITTQFKAFNLATSHTLKNKLQDLYNAKLKSTGARTATDHKSHLKKLYAFCAANNLLLISPKYFNLKMASKFMSELYNSTSISNRTYNNHLSTYRHYWELLIESGEVEKNVFKTIRKKTVKESDLDYFSDDELEVLKNNLPRLNNELWIIANLIYSCFLRPAEIVRLKPSNFAIQRMEIRVNGSQGKNGKTQVVAIPDHLKGILNSYLEKVPADNYLFSTGLKNGTKLQAPTRIAEKWKKIVIDKIGIKRTIYKLKHTGNGKLVYSGANVRDVQLQNRHHSLSQTQIYLDKFSRVVSDDFRNALPSF